MTTIVKWHELSCRYLVVIVDDESNNVNRISIALYKKKDYYLFICMSLFWKNVIYYHLPRIEKSRVIVKEAEKKSSFEMVIHQYNCTLAALFFYTPS